MQFERLRELHRRVTAPEADSQMPVALESAFLVGSPESVPELRSYPVKTAIFFYNCGTQNGKLISVESQSPGVRVIAHINAEMLPAYTALEHAFRCEVELHPLELAPTARSAEFLVRWRNQVSLKTETTTVSLPYKRASGGAELEILFEVNEIHFDDLWIDDLRVFELAAREAKEASLHIEAGPAKGVYPMVRQGERFAAAVVIAREAEAHYRFCVDGRFVTDETVLETTHVPGVDTDCTPLPPAGAIRRTVRIQNVGSATADLSIAKSAPWLVCNLNGCSLQPGASQELTLSVEADSLTAREYADELRLVAHTRQNTMLEWKLSVRVSVRSAGPLCRSESRYKLGVVHFGEEKRRTIKVSDPADAVLELEGTSEDGMVSVPRQQVEAGGELELALHFDFRRMTPANGARESRLILTTNSWVESRKRVEIALNYDLVALRTTPEFIDFGVISGAQVCSFSVSGFLGAGAAPVAGLAIEDAPAWISWQRNPESGQYTLLVSGDGLAAYYAKTISGEEGLPVREGLILRDMDSGATGMLPIRGIFAHPRVRCGSLRFGSVKQTKQLPLPLTNQGLGTLVIHKVEIDVPWLQVAWSADAASHLQVVASRQRLLGKMEGAILIHTNDPQKPVTVMSAKANFGG